MKQPKLFTVKHAAAAFGAALENHRKVEALRLARTYIASGHEIYICNALAAVADRRPHMRRACRELRTLIMDRLNGHHTLTAWLPSNVPAARKTLLRSPKAFRRKMLITRLAWIDALIKEFS